MKKERGDILDNITLLRKSKGFSQDYMASKIGMKQAGYALIEKGERGLQYNVLLQIAIVLGVDVVDIITYPDVYAKEDSDSNREPVEAILQIKLQSDTKDQVLKLVFGEHNLEILNK